MLQALISGLQGLGLTNDVDVDMFQAMATDDGLSL